MKNRLVFTALFCLGLASLAQAQTPKFGHINLEELVSLMPARDSAMKMHQKFAEEMQEQYEAIQNEYRVKVNEYEQRHTTWTSSILEMKQREIYDIQQRLEVFREGAAQEMRTLENALFAPLFAQANEAIQKIAKEMGLIYVFNSAIFHYVDEAQSINLMDKAKAALKIPAEKVAPALIGGM